MHGLREGIGLRGQDPYPVEKNININTRSKITKKITSYPNSPLTANKITCITLPPPPLTHTFLRDKKNHLNILITTKVCTCSSVYYNQKMFTVTFYNFRFLQYIYLAKKRVFKILGI